MSEKKFDQTSDALITIGDYVPLPPFKPTTKPQVNTVCDPKTRRVQYRMWVEDKATGKDVVWIFGQKVYDQIKNLPPGKKSITIKG